MFDTAAGETTLLQPESQVVVQSPDLGLETRDTPVQGKTIPALPALDMEETLRFYARLGFRVAAHYGKETFPSQYSIIRRGEMELHFWGCDDRRIVDYTGGCYVRVSDARALYDEFRSKSVAPLGELEDKPWGMREFYVIDPNNNLIRIGQDL